MFEKSFMNRDEATEHCILMVEEHPHVGESLNGLAELYSNQASTLRRSRSIKSRWRSLPLTTEASQATPANHLIL